MEKRQKTKNLIALLVQEDSTDLSLCEKESIARLLISTLLPEDCHRYKNRPYEFPSDFCCIYSACVSLKARNDERYQTVHRFFLRCSKNDWNKVSFFNYFDTLSLLLLVAESRYPDSLKKQLVSICELTKDLDFLSHRYDYLMNTIFPTVNDENTFKKNLLLSLCTSDREEFSKVHKLSSIKAKVSSLSLNPYN